VQQDVHFLVSGGLVMVPLILCGIISVAIMIDRFLAIGAAVVDNRQLIAAVERHVTAGEYDAALKACDAQGGSVATVLASGLRVRDRAEVEIERQMEEFALRQMPAMVERLGVLDTIVTVAPLLGLLGTITGMIKAFQIVGTAGLNAPAQITGGIAEALIATSTGLTITIFTLPAYNYLTERVRENVSEMEWRATQLLNLFAQARRKA
jgi:biopolymer transport protein ExbB